MTHTQTRTVQDTHVLDIVGRFDSSSAEQIASQLDSLSSIPNVRVIVNMDETSFVDSTGL
jgi:anti-anti-sigma factor